jgi:hypothetical protein
MYIFSLSFIHDWIYIINLIIKIKILLEYANKFLYFVLYKLIIFNFITKDKTSIQIRCCSAEYIARAFIYVKIEYVLYFNFYIYYNILIDNIYFINFFGDISVQK